jgi:hypothetical protein
MAKQQEQRSPGFSNPNDLNAKVLIFKVAIFQVLIKDWIKDEIYRRIAYGVRRQGPYSCRDSKIRLKVHSMMEISFFLL